MSHAPVVVHFSSVMGALVKSVCRKMLRRTDFLRAWPVVRLLWPVANSAPGRSLFNKDARPAAPLAHRIAESSTFPTAYEA
jgi:hypothetical protein